MNTVHLIGAEQVERAGRNMAGAADTIERAASSIDRSADHLARTMDEAVTRFAGNLAEHDAERLTLRDEFAMAALRGMLGGAPGQHLQFDNAAREAYLHADAMLKARQS